VKANGWRICSFFRGNSVPVSAVTKFSLSVSPSAVILIVSGLLEKLVQWETACLPRQMTPDVADARWCRPCYLRGQPLFQLTSVGRRNFGWELQVSTAIGGPRVPWWML
jgi:hypothetical protein